MLGLQFGRGGIVADAALLTQKPAVPPIASIVPAAQPLLRTPEGKIFAVLRGDEAALNEWNGKRWLRHPFPDNQGLWGSCKLTSDSKGCVWFVDALYNPDPKLVPTYVFDPDRNRFQKFSSVRTALQAGLAAHPDLRIDPAGAFAPEFTRDGRACYESDWFVNYFDGHQWRAWNKANGILTGEYLRGGQGENFCGRQGALGQDQGREKGLMGLPAIALEAVVC